MKLMVIGLDSASPILIKRWIDKLPNLRSLIDTGTHGILQSVIPPMSCPAWQCFATGKNPARIGVFGFVSIGPDRKLVHGKTTQEIGAFWDLASREGMKVGVFNVPGTYPPYPVNGFMVSGFPTPPKKVWAYPTELMDRLNSAVKGYEIDVPLTRPSEMLGGEKAHLAQVSQLHSKCVEAAKFLLKSYDLDLFVMTFQAIDQVQHDFARYVNLPDSPYSTVIQDWYVKLDEAVGELKAWANPANLLVLSDHGSMPIRMAFHINEFLRSQNILSLKSGQGKKKNYGAYKLLRNIVLKTLPPGAIKTFYGLVPHSLAYKLTHSGQIDRMLTSLVDSIDWTKTRAFSTGGPQAYIYINSQEFDGGNLANPESRAQLIESLEEKLGDLTHPLTGDKICAVFYRKEEVFPGPYQNQAPDLCAELFGHEEKIHIAITFDSGNLWSFSPHFSADHVREGFWTMVGPDILPGTSLNANILDLAPTILKILRLNVPSDIDGKLLEQIFSDNTAPEIAKLAPQKPSLAVN
jgi:predicted AlkP superfamily phosphohydrolase/phosphomutase